LRSSRPGGDETPDQETARHAEQTRAPHNLQPPDDRGRTHAALASGQNDIVTIPIDEVAERAIAMHKYVAGLPPEYQSAVIAHLLATWIAGHQGDDKAALAKFREELLTGHIKLVRDLIPMEDARLAKRKMPRR
jgi:hypothetical protein